jgi:hypothetical protein
MALTKYISQIWTCFKSYNDANNTQWSAIFLFDKEFDPFYSVLSAELHIASHVRKWNNGSFG